MSANRLPDVRLRDTAGVIVPPPALYGAALIIALALHYVVLPLRIASPPTGLLLPLAGMALIILGLSLSIAVMRSFGRAGTPVPPSCPTTRFVSAGPYRYTRNPDYIGQTLLYTGIALVTNSWWPLILLPLVLLVVHYGVVRREERYLEGKFGQEYRNYTARVRRWL
ncbi:MAG TPA: isoprenylcysteine carboxylmethyltransferase family protein [Gemmatimonadaceae bacterium]|nr:isoprenylcysteine carboxylmethyltransferase family protein [Gemmatimonadaceae bacterium]